MEIKVVTKELFEQYMDQYCALYHLCFNQPMTEQEVRWRYLDHPKNDIMACFAIDNGRLAASYSASPTDLILNGERIPAILSLNTMTHPDYSGQGLFIKLAKLVYAYAQKSGYRLVYGFPNYISNRTFVSKLGWKDIYEIPTLEWEVDTSRIPQLDGDAVITEDSEFKLDYSGCLQQTGVSVMRTRDFLNWRYAKNTSNKYRCFVMENNGKVSSYLICKEYKERLNIIDYFMSDSYSTQAMFNWCLRFGAEAGKELVTTWSKMGSSEHLYLEKLGFKNKYPITYLGACVFDDPESAIYDYKNWTVRMGDDNVY